MSVTQNILMIGGFMKEVMKRFKKGVKDIRKGVKIEACIVPMFPLKPRLLSIHVIETTERFMGMQKYLEVAKHFVFGPCVY